MNKSVTVVSVGGCPTAILRRMPIDWHLLRRALGRLRTAQRREDDGKSWTLENLREKSGIEISTIHRVENTKKYPNYKPDLFTVERWVIACGGVTLSEFFLQLEGVQIAEETGKADVYLTETSRYRNGIIAPRVSSPPEGDGTATHVPPSADRNQYEQLGRAVGSFLRSQLPSQRTERSSGRDPAPERDRDAETTRSKPRRHRSSSRR